MTTFLIGSLLCYINTDSVYSLCDTVKTRYEATYGEMTIEAGSKVHLHSFCFALEIFCLVTFSLPSWWWFP